MLPRSQAVTPGHLLQKAVGILVTARPSWGFWPVEGVRPTQEVLPLHSSLQFDKFTPKLDSPYFRHSNVSPCAPAQSSLLRVRGMLRRVG